FAERVTIPFQAGHFAGFTANARGGVHQLADLEFPVHPGARDGPGVSRNPDDFRWGLAHGRSYAFSTFTKKPLVSGVWAFGSVTVGVSKFAGVRASLPASSVIPRKPW